MTPAEVAMLRFLRRRETVLHLAVVMPFHQELAERGYVVLRPHDRGGVSVELTASGSAVLSDAGVQTSEVRRPL